MWRAERQRDSDGNIVFHETFLRHVPCNGIGRKESKLMPFGEVLRTVVTEIEIEQVTIHIPVRYASSQSLVPTGYPLHNITANIGGVHIIVLCIFKDTGYIVISEISPIYLSLIHI